MTRIESGNPVIDQLFLLCVQFLMWLADLTGTSYNTVNVWIFCIIWPLVTVWLLGTIVWLHGTLQWYRCDEPFSGCLDCDVHNKCLRYRNHRRKYEKLY